MTDLIINLPDDLKALAQEKAKQLWRSLDEVVKDFLADFVVNDIKNLKRNVNFNEFFEENNDDSFKSQEWWSNHKPIRKISNKDSKYKF